MSNLQRYQPPPRDVIEAFASAPPPERADPTRPFSRSKKKPQSTVPS